MSNEKELRDALKLAAYEFECIVANLTCDGPTEGVGWAIERAKKAAGWVKEALTKENEGTEPNLVLNRPKLFICEHCAETYTNFVGHFLNCSKAPSADELVSRLMKSLGNEGTEPPKTLEETLWDPAPIGEAKVERCRDCGGPVSETQPILFPGLMQCEDGDCAGSFMMPAEALRGNGDRKNLSKPAGS